MHSVRALTTCLIDYAGLFPPASLEMEAAVRNYADYLAGPEAFMLGRFIVPATRLDEFANTARPLLPKGGSTRPWQVSALLSENSATEIPSILKFNADHATGLRFGHSLIDSVEFRAGSPAEISRINDTLPPGFRAFVEISPDRLDLLDLLTDAGFAAKIRTGGITADAFPEARSITEFMAACKERGTAFKATAGLHHIVCGSYPLTYDIGSKLAPMFGFLNLFAAAIFLFHGMDTPEVTNIISEASGQAFHFDEDRLQWREHSVTSQQIALARKEFAISFGSCSFTEPVDELKTLIGSATMAGR